MRPLIIPVLFLLSATPFSFAYDGLSPSHRQKRAPQPALNNKGNFFKASLSLRSDLGDDTPRESDDSPGGDMKTNAISYDRPNTFLSLRNLNQPKKSLVGFGGAPRTTTTTPSPIIEVTNEDGIITALGKSDLDFVPARQIDSPFIRQVDPPKFTPKTTTTEKPFVQPQNAPAFFGGPDFNQGASIPDVNKQAEFQNFGHFPPQQSQQGLPPQFLQQNQQSQFAPQQNQQGQFPPQQAQQGLGFIPANNMFQAVPQPPARQPIQKPAFQQNLAANQNLVQAAQARQDLNMDPNAQQPQFGQPGQDFGQMNPQMPGAMGQFQPQPSQQSFDTFSGAPQGGQQFPQGGQQFPQGGQFMTPGSDQFGQGNSFTSQQVPQFPAMSGNAQQDIFQQVALPQNPGQFDQFNAAATGQFPQAQPGQDPSQMAPLDPALNGGQPPQLPQPQFGADPNGPQFNNQFGPQPGSPQFGQPGTPQFVQPQPFSAQSTGNFMQTDQFAGHPSVGTDGLFIPPNPNQNSVPIDQTTPSPEVIEIPSTPDNVVESTTAEAARSDDTVPVVGEQRAFLDNMSPPTRGEQNAAALGPMARSSDADAPYAQNTGAVGRDAYGASMQPGYSVGMGPSTGYSGGQTNYAGSPAYGGGSYPNGGGAGYGPAMQGRGPGGGRYSPFLGGIGGGTGFGYPSGGAPYPYGAYGGFGYGYRPYYLGYNYDLAPYGIPQPQDFLLYGKNTLHPEKTYYAKGAVDSAATGTATK